MDGLHRPGEGAAVDQPSVRAARVEDAPAVRDLTRAAYARWVPRIGREPAPMTADVVAVIARHAVDLRVLGEAVAGGIERVVEPAGLLIETVAAAHEHQGRGFGRIRLARAERRALGKPRIRLCTNAAFTETIALYLR